MMKKPTAVFCLLFIGLMTIAAGRGGATTLLAKDFEDLARQADIVFVGTVADIYSDWRDQGENAIYTYVTFVELEVIAGGYQGDSIEVRLSGGEVDGVIIEYIGVPKFSLGERNLIFLEGNNKKLCPIVGWGQGFFKVVIDEDTGEEVLYSPGGQLVAKMQDNKFILSSVAPRVTGTPGVHDYNPPNQPPAQIFKVEAAGRLTVRSLAESIIDTRAELKKKGIKTGYWPPVFHPGKPEIPPDDAYSRGSTSPACAQADGDDILSVMRSKPPEGAMGKE